MCDRDTEDGQHGVAYELLERASEVDDGLGQPQQRAVDSGPDLLGIEFVDEARVADEVREERGDDAPVAGLQAVRERVETPAALVTEAGARSRGC